MLSLSIISPKWFVSVKSFPIKDLLVSIALEWVSCSEGELIQKKICEWWTCVWQTLQVLIHYPHFRSLSVFSHYMKMRWVPTGCNWDVTLGFILLYLGFYPWPGNISQQPPALADGFSQEISRSSAVYLFEHNGVSSSFHGIATSESLNITPWLCLFARSKHLLRCQALVLISNSHNVFVPHLLHYLIGSHFWSKGRMVWQASWHSFASFETFPTIVYASGFL